MFQRLSSLSFKSSEPKSREESYKFLNLDTIESDEENGSPEKIILEELKIRKKPSPVQLRPLRDADIEENKDNNEAVVVEETENQTTASDDFYIQTNDTNNENTESEIYYDNVEAFDMYVTALGTPAKGENKLPTMYSPSPSKKATKLVSPLPSPGDARFKTSRFQPTKILEKKLTERSPLAKIDENVRRKAEDKLHVENFDEEDDSGVDVELIFSRIRHNRIPFVVEQFENGCDPFVKVI
jgi:hypothetical protein